MSLDLSVSVCVSLWPSMHGSASYNTLKHRSVLVPLIISMGLLRFDPLCYEATSPGGHTRPENVSYPSCSDIFI